MENTPETSSYNSMTSTAKDEMAELLLQFNFSPIPAIYIGIVTARLGELYKQTTDDDLYFVAAENGSLKLRMHALKRHLEPFSRVLGKVVGQWFTPERIKQILDQNLNAVTSIYVDKHKKLQAEINGLQVAVTKDTIETKLKVVKEFPAFVREMMQLRKDINPDVTPEELRLAARSAAKFYVTFFDLGGEGMLDDSMGLNSSIQDLKDSITVQLSDCD